ncbi:Gldg family protein [Chitinophaga sp. NPDC101104]|uniref:Gldg family protein n=1 Tax=Chitinophaga sp. NPDC101104 TaxID=3390561 RepID=UPI003CFBFB72
MKLLLKIAKNEFRHLFYSPIAWFLLIVFLVQCAIFYVIPVFHMALTQDMVLANNMHRGLGKLEPDPMTAEVFLRGGLFSYAVSNLYLFVPLLTMGLISRENNSGTSRLLFSSPVRLREIVLGKYAGIMFFNLLLIAVVGIFMSTGAFNIRHVDYGLLISASLGFYLIVCACSAIGMYMSSLSNYQIVSALATFTIIFVLGRIGSLWQKYDFVRDLTYFLSLQNRTGKMLTGLVTTKDVIYFLAVSGMFIGFTLVRLKNGRESKPWYVRTGRYAAVAVVTLAVGYLSSRPALTGYWDATGNKRNTIHPRTQQLLRNLGDSSLEVTLYTNLIDQNAMAGLPEMRNSFYMARFWENYLRFRPDIRFKYVYYYDVDDRDSTPYKYLPGKNLDQIAAEMADGMDLDTSLFLPPAEIRRQIDLKSEGYRLVMQLRHKGRTEFLRTFVDGFIWPDEMVVDAALKRLVEGKSPRFLYVTGQLERSILQRADRDYYGPVNAKTGRRALVNIGFDVDTINLSLQDIPPGISGLVLADPRMELPPLVMEKLRKYVREGGNMMLLGEPGKQYVMNPLLRELGVQMRYGQLVQPTFDETPDMVKPYLTDSCAGLAEESIMLALRRANALGVKADTATTLMPGVTALEFADSAFSVAPLAMTMPGRAWLKAGPFVRDSTLPPMDPAQGDAYQASFPTILGLTRNIGGKEQRIVVCGDADFISNARVAGNFFGNAFYSWLSNHEFPIYTPGEPAKDTQLSITGDAAGLQKTIFLWVVPGILLAAGMILLIRRKRK